MKTDTESHLRMTQRRREGHEKKQASATLEKGLLIVNTGNGKGKSTAAFGMAVRMLGRDERVYVMDKDVPSLDKTVPLVKPRIVFKNK